MVAVRNLIAAIGDLSGDGHSIVCVAGITADDAVRRLEATPTDEEDVEAAEEDPWDNEELSLRIIGVTDVPGGCIVSQPWGYAASMPGVQKLLSVDTVCYGMYANPKSGNQGSAAQNGVITEWDTHPGYGSAGPDASSEEILASYLYHMHAEVELCSRAGLQLPDSRAITGNPDLWVTLPERDFWG